MQVTKQDYNRLLLKETTITALCQKYGLTPAQLKKQIDRYGAIKTRFTPEEREELRKELLQACPHDHQYGISSILRRWGIGTITRALQLLKVPTLSALRGLPPDLRTSMNRYGLKLINDRLYAPAYRGLYHEERQVVVDLDELKNNPDWIEKNIDMIKSVCYDSTAKSKILKPKVLRTKQLRKRYDTLVTVMRLIQGHYTQREIVKLVGTNAYTKELRELKDDPDWLDKMLTDKERKDLGL